jgi:hypothetical protein
MGKNSVNFVEYSRNAITACVEFKVTIEFHVSPKDHGGKPEASNKIAKP